ncbi:MAG TPA: hypothetical protein VFQ76_02685 [Longimicrobiaceae bacterium]|nr:hypothetical protein [Longimicrobiaceae bacterium]
MRFFLMSKCALSFCLLLAMPGVTHAANGVEDRRGYLLVDRQAEIALAMTAAPDVISGGAAVYVLTERGFEETRPGANGFACLVARAFNGSISDIPSWSNKQILAPHCLNALAVKTVLPEMRLRASLFMQGLEPTRIVDRIRAAYAGGELSTPSAGALAYMLSPKQHLSEESGPWIPHLMFYFPGNPDASAWGAGDGESPVIDGGVDEPTGTRVLLIPTSRWSDGTPVKAQ